MTTKEILVSVVHGNGMEPIIQIYDADQVNATLAYYAERDR